MKNYTKSEQLAISNGFIEVIDENAFNGRCFMKNDLIWIHDITALKNKMGVIYDDELEEHHYDVETYYELKNQNNDDCNCAYSTDMEEDMVYLADGVYIKESERWF